MRTINRPSGAASSSSPVFPRALWGLWLRRILPMWSFIALVIFLMQIGVCAIVHDNENVRTLLKFLELMPSVVKTALGGEMLAVGNTAALIAIGYQHPLVLFLYLLYAVGVPTSLLTSEVQKGTMELILSRPTTKTQVYLGAAALTLAGMVLLTIVMFLGTVAATRVYDFGEPVPLGLFLRIATNGACLAGAAGGVALLAAGVLGGRPAAVGATVAFLVLNYFGWVLAQWWPRVGFLKPALLFNYVNPAELNRGWPVSDMAVLAAVLVVSVLVGGVVWQRRDLPL